MDCEELVVIRSRIVEWLLCDYPKERKPPEESFRQLFATNDYRLPSIVDRAKRFVIALQGNDAGECLVAHLVTLRDRFSRKLPPDDYDKTQTLASAIEWWCGSTFDCDTDEWSEIALLQFPRPADSIQQFASETTPKATPQKKKKIRRMNTAAADCARIYRKRKGEDTMKSVVEDYVAERGGCESSIMRVLNDNPDQWKNDT